jgi:putative hydrolase of the HAD superfamily
VSEPPEPQRAQGIRNVIFDLGGVVLHWNPDEVLSAFQQDAELRRELRQQLFAHADWQQFDRGALTETQVIDRIEARLGRPRAEVTAIVDAVRDSLVEKPDTVRLIRLLHQRGIALYCLSNMPASIYAHLRIRHGFWDLFSGIVISGEVQMVKPEPEVYAHLLQRFELQPEQTVFVDDLAVNIDAAGRAGLHTILFHDAGQCARELEHMLGIQPLLPT